jgi:hypothetical protein
MKCASRNDGAATKIENLRGRSFEFLDLCRAPDGDNSSIFNRQRLHDRETVIDSNDLAAEQHGISRWLRRSGGAPRNCKQSDDEGCDGSHA